jgi:hypothetical protein
MGVDFRATAMIGVELDKSKMMKKYEARGCEHEISSQDAKYCAICGKEIWVEYEDYLEVFSEEPETSDGDALKSGEVFSGGYQLAYTTNCDRVLIGIKVSAPTHGGREAEMWKFSYYSYIVDGIIRDLSEYLKPYGLWDESKFGLWAIAYVSY